jgi:ribosome-binding ATPase YchF (GTP1/OBG family)
LINIAILGKRQSGKSTLFDTIVGRREHKERKGILILKDENLDFLHTLYPEAKKTNIHIEIIDTEVINFNDTLIRDSDIFIYVIPLFENGKMEILKSFIDDIIINDISVIENRLKKLEKSHERLNENEPRILKEMKEFLEKGRKLIEFGEIPSYLKGFNFLSTKPLIGIGNISEEMEEKEDVIFGIPVIFSKCKLQKEMEELEEKDREEFKNMFGIKEPLKDKLIEYIVKSLNLIRFYTANKNEVKSYFLKKGENVLKAAGIIHSDFEKGFVRASVINIQDLKRFGDEKKAKECGCYKVEGKEYIVQDGDVIYIRSSL